MKAEDADRPSVLIEIVAPVRDDSSDEDGTSVGWVVADAMEGASAVDMLGGTVEKLADD